MFSFRLQANTQTLCGSVKQFGMIEASVRELSAKYFLELPEPALRVSTVPLCVKTTKAYRMLFKLRVFCGRSRHFSKWCRYLTLLCQLHCGEHMSSRSSCEKYAT